MKYIFIVLLLTISTLLISQDKGDKVVIKDTVGNQYIGTIISKTPEECTIENAILGEVSLATSSIASISFYKEELIESTSTKPGWFTPPVPSINYLTETAFGLNKGEYYYQNILLFGHKFGIGISESFSLNAGFELASLVFDNSAPALLIAPKFTFKESKANVRYGIGTNFIYLSEISSTSFVGSIYGLATFGDYDNNFTVGLGMGYDNFNISSSPVLQLSGQVRLSRAIGLVLDSLSTNVFGDFGSGASLMLRLMTKDLLLDLGILGASDGGAIPMANFAVKF